MSRTAVATVLVLLACLLAGPGLAAYALSSEIIDRERYLHAVTPLADDPAVRRDIATAVTNAIDKRFGGMTLPGARRALDDAVGAVVETDAFRRAWVAGHRAVHPRVLAMLREEDGSLRIDGDTVLLDLGAVVDEMRDRLVANDVPFAERIPDVDASIELVSRPAIRSAIPAFGTLEALRVVLPVVVIALLAGGLAISARRGRTLTIAGAGVALAMLGVLLFQAISRGRLTARSKSPELAGAFYDALTSHLTLLLWVVFGVGMVMALAGIAITLVGRAQPSVGTRSG